METAEEGKAAAAGLVSAWPPARRWGRVSHGQGRRFLGPPAQQAEGPLRWTESPPAAAPPPDPPPMCMVLGRNPRKAQAPGPGRGWGKAEGASVIAAELPAGSLPGSRRRPP